MNDAPIGLFDSGFGGLTVLREVMRALPCENLIYLGDTAHLPYGNKSPQTVLQYARDNADFLLKKGIKLLIIACNTACSHALDILQKELPIPVLGVIEPGVKLASRFNRIAILGTTSTIQSGIYQTLLKPAAEIHPVACPLFVPLIEEGFHDHLATQTIASAYLSHLKNIDAALLACTHYPLIRTSIQQVLGKNVTIIEPAEQCAIEAKNYLTKAHLLNNQIQKPTPVFWVTDDPEKFLRVGSLFFGNLIDQKTVFLQ